MPSTQKHKILMLCTGSLLTGMSVIGHAESLTGYLPASFSE